jgi:hypothetical protein
MPFHKTPAQQTSLRIINGDRPRRPHGDAINPSDVIWKMIEGCWSQDHRSRPHMDAVRHTVASRASRPHMDAVRHTVASQAEDISTNCESLPDELDRVICCSVELLESRRACRESVTIPLLAFERVLQTMAFCESRLESLLAVQGESAMRVLEALQMVR